MASNSPTPRHETASVWRQLDELIQEIGELARGGMAEDAFHPECLNRVVSGLAACGAVLWIGDGPAGQLTPRCRIALAGSASLDAALAKESHRELVASVISAGAGKSFPPHAAWEKGDSSPNPTEFLLIVSPWLYDGQRTGAIAVFQHPDLSPSAQWGYLEFLSVVGQLIAEYYRNRDLLLLREQVGESRRISEFAEEVHRNLDLGPTAYAIANDGRRAIGCDRMSVLVRRGRRCSLVAVSGIDTFHRRAAVVTPMERLAAAAVLWGQPLWHPDSAEEIPRELAELIAAYVDQSDARGLAVLPLAIRGGEDRAGPNEAIGVLVVERFHSPCDEAVRRRATALCGHAALALRNAVQLQRIPLARTLRTLARARCLLEGRRLPVTILALAVVAAVVAALVFVPADFTVEARGKLQPVRVRDVFAPVDGVVRDLLARHGQTVEPDEILAVLRRSELEMEFKRVWGELQTANKRRGSIDAERLQNRRETEAQRQRYAQLSAELEEIRELIASLEAQHVILKRQEKQLEVRSPIRGEVLTWDPEQLLQARPVVRGQAILTVADLEGPWRLELRVADRHVAHLRAAQEASGEPLPVRYILATDPGRRLSGSIEQVGMRTELGETEGAFVLVHVAVRSEDIPERTPGAGVTAKISCGRRAIGYVWLHDLVDAIRSWLLF